MNTRLQNAMLLAAAAGVSMPPYYNTARLDRELSILSKGNPPPPIPQHELDLIARAKAKKDRKAAAKAQAKQQP